jgi:hypothetical protein
MCAREGRILKQFSLRQARSITLRRGERTCCRGRKDDLHGPSDERDGHRPNFRGRLRLPRHIAANSYLDSIPSPGLPFSARKLIISSHRRTDCSPKHGNPGWRFMHDGATCHMAATSIAYLNDMANMLPDWSLESPEFSSIGNMCVILQH